MSRLIRWTVRALAFGAIAGGEQTAVTHPDEDPPVSDVKFADVTPEQWATLGSRRILFGHQSVGDNILQGIGEVMASNPAIPLRIVEIVGGGGDTPGGPGLYRARIGRNGDPASKRADFSALADSTTFDVAMMKFCYIDVDGRTDPNSMFDAYQREIDALVARHPGLRIVHVTMPLTEEGNWKGRLVSRVKGRPTARHLNRTRDVYNTRLRAAYDGRAPIFDVARIESTRADGSRSRFLDGNEPVYFLAPELTDDGGHLNAVGRRTAAEYLLALLATL